MNKKRYVAPKMDVVEMKASVALLQDSAEGAPENVMLYSDELGFDFTPESDPKV